MHLGMATFAPAPAADYSVHATAPRERAGRIENSGGDIQYALSRHIDRSVIAGGLLEFARS